MKTLIASLILVCLPVAAPAQDPGGNPPIRVPLYPRLTAFLELTTGQILELGRLEVEWQRYLNQKVRRVAQVNGELREITLAPVVDPSALGVRYMELEAICREARDTEEKTRASARKLLTGDQLAKLAGLEQAYALLPVVGEAGFAHLIAAPLPGLNLQMLGASAGRSFPGCRFPPVTAVLAPLPPGMNSSQ